MQYILNGYDERPFSLLERLMTQPRIILMYISQLFFPLPHRLSIAHDVTLSVSLFEPWTTLPALVIVIGSIALAFKNANRYPLLTFAILFYFLNHVVESSVLPLELVFEHRNYLPSMFIFLPLAAGLLTLFDRLRHHSGFYYATAIGIIILVVVGFGLGTYTRNKAWATPQTLWLDASAKAPGSIRPLVNLGIQLAWKENPTSDNLRHALVLFQHSLELVPSRAKEKSEILGNIASVYFHQNAYEKAVEFYRQALSIDQDF